MRVAHVTNFQRRRPATATTHPVAGQPRGDGHADLFSEHADRLLAAVSGIVRTSRVNVDDACGFAWLQLVRHEPQPESAFRWLCRTAIREAIKLHRRTARAASLEQVAEEPADPVAGPDVQLDVIISGEDVRSARLRPREARVLGLRVAGYSRDEMADLTGDSPRTIDRQLGRARRKLEQARRRSAEVA